MSGIPYIGMGAGGSVRLVWQPSSGHPLDLGRPLAAIEADPNPFPNLRLIGRSVRRTRVRQAGPVQPTGESTSDEWWPA